MEKRFIPASTEVMLSCEVYPPKSPAARASFETELPKLLELPFQLMTVTHGAGGSELGGTATTLTRIRGLSDIPTAAHLCCRGASEGMLVSQLQDAERAGAGWILALRGDGRSPTPAGELPFEYAVELVELTRRRFPQFKVAVAGYPETHPEATDAPTDVAFLKRKVEAGADVVVCQFFFDNQIFFDFHDRCRRVGIEVPIIPGILPVKSLEHVERLCGQCGAYLPGQLRERLSSSTDPVQAGLAHTIEQVAELVEWGVSGLHFYCLNQSQPVKTILKAAVGARAKEVPTHNPPINAP